MLAKRLKTANRHGRELEGQVAFLPVYVRAHNSFAAPARVSFASKMALFRALADHTNSRNATLSAQRDRDRTGAEDMRSALILKFVNEKYGPNYTSVLADVERFRKRRMRKWFEVLKEVDARLMAVSEDNPGTAPAMYVLDPAVEIAAAENAPRRMGLRRFFRRRMRRRSVRPRSRPCTPQNAAHVRPSLLLGKVAVRQDLRLTHRRAAYLLSLASSSAMKTKARHVPAHRRPTSPPGASRKSANPGHSKPAKRSQLSQSRL